MIFNFEIMSRLIGITIGDPKGIGPEITVKALPYLPAELRGRIKLYGDEAIFEEARRLADSHGASGARPNITDEDAAKIALRALDAAICDAKSREISAIVTAPVNKRRMRRVLPDFIGHTQYLASASAAADVTMMFISDTGDRPRLVVSLATTHVPYAKVPSMLTCDCITSTIVRTSEVLKRYLRKKTIRIAVLGLNPHAGEEGLMGAEEEDIVIPSIADAILEGVECEGPFPADSFFTASRMASYDAVVALYHDQGLAPMKIIGGRECVNATLGLPYVRTSPGHGTAEDIAWQARADKDGMISAIMVADKLITPA